MTYSRAVTMPVWAVRAAALAVVARRREIHGEGYLFPARTRDGRLVPTEQKAVQSGVWMRQPYSNTRPEEVRTRYDLSSLEIAIHAAAPCPIPVKRAMIEWWGPILIEYYAGSEGNGVTVSTSQQWLTHRGTVGRAVVGNLTACMDEEIPPGAPLWTDDAGGMEL